MDVNRLQPAVVLAGLACEVLLKSFLIEEDLGGVVRTSRGHELIALTTKMMERDRLDLQEAFRSLYPEGDLFRGLAQFGGVFLEARYRYESDAMQVISSETVYFARELCEAVLFLGRRRGS